MKPALSVLLIAGIVGAQDVRIAHPGRVRDSDGKPAAGARVTFVTVDGRPGQEAPDIVRAVAAENGRFRVALLPTRAYRAWAAVGDPKAPLLSAMVARGAPITEIDLPKVGRAAGPPLPKPWRPQGVDAWKELGPLRVRFLLDSVSGLVADAEVDREGAFVVPPLPQCRIDGLVFANDQLVHYAPLFSAGAIPLPPPQRISVVVVDHQGEPVEGAILSRLVQLWAQPFSAFPRNPISMRHRAGVSDKEGRAEIVVAHNNDPFQGGGWPTFAFIATKAGFAESVAGVTQLPFVNGEVHDIDKDKPELLFKLAERKVRSLQLRGGRPEPARIAFEGFHSAPYNDDGSTTSLTDNVYVDVDADGRATWLDSPLGYSVTTLRAPGVMPPIAVDDPFRRAAARRSLVLPIGWLRGDDVLDLGSVVGLRIQVLDANAGPASGARLVCVALGSDGFVDASTADVLEVDAAGRAVVPTLPGQWLVLAIAGDSWARLSIDVEAGLPVQKLQLAPLARCLVRAVDKGGKPLVGATVGSNGSSWVSGGSHETEFLRKLGTPIANFFLSKAKTDESGLATIPCLTVQGLQINCRVRHNGKKSAEFPLQAGDEPMDIIVK